MSWLSSALKKSYKWKEKHLKPKEIKKFEDAVPLAVGLINPVAGVIAEGLHLARKSQQAAWDAEDAARQAEIEQAQGPTVVDEVPAQDPIDYYPQYGGASAAAGGIPVSMFNQLGMGLMQQTPAVLRHLSKAAGSRGGRVSAMKRKKRFKKKSAARTTKTRRKAGTKRARLVKGSAAAKAWGKRMRKARRKK